MLGQRRIRFQAAIVAFLLSPVILSAQTITSVTFEGSPANPLIIISGSGFGTAPAPTSPAYPPYSGMDYGTALHITDFSNDPFTFDAGQENPAVGNHDDIGLANLSYSDTLISYNLGTEYTTMFYPNGVYSLGSGDSYTVFVLGASFSGTVSYCTLPETESSTFQGFWQASTRPYLATVAKFSATLSDSSGDSFSGRMVRETFARFGFSSCTGVPTFIIPAPYGSPPWSVNSGNVFEYDSVGYPTDLVTDIRNGVLNPIPCTAMVYQQMQMQCPAGGAWENYGTVNTLTITVGATTVTSSRQGVSGTETWPMNAGAVASETTMTKLSAIPLLALGGLLSTEAMTVQDQRVVFGAILQMQIAHPNWQISYEDPPYSRTSPNSPPKIETLTLDDALFKEPDPLRAVTGILDAYASNIGTPLFKAVRTGDLIEVVPTIYSDAAKATQAASSILDTPITLSTKEMTGSEYVRALAAELTKETDILVMVEDYGGNLQTPFFTEHLSNEARLNGTARALMEQLVNEEPKLVFSWVLRCVPTRTGGVAYILQLSHR